MNTRLMLKRSPMYSEMDSEMAGSAFSHWRVFLLVATIAPAKSGTASRSKLPAWSSGLRGGDARGVSRPVREPRRRGARSRDGGASTHSPPRPWFDMSSGYARLAL